MSSRLHTLLVVVGFLTTSLQNTTLEAAAPPAKIKLVLESVGDIRPLEKQVQAVVAKVTPAVVGVIVGPSFGSGVLIKGGYVLTAAHVSREAGRDVTIILPSGRRLRGKTLGRHISIDSGLIKIADRGNWPTAEVGKSSTLKKNQWVVAIGQPGGFRRNRTPVVRLGRVLQSNASLIRTDCTLVGGDSGGPLFDLDGNVVGIHSRIGFSIGDNMHVPVDTFTATWNRLVRGETWGGPIGSGLPDVPSRGGKIAFEKKGTLTAADPRDKKRTDCHYQVHEFKMVPGFDYTLDLTAGRGRKPFDPYLRLEDSAGKTLAEDDDGGGGQNARIVFRPFKEDTYRITLTTCDPNQTGRFSFTIRQFDLKDQLVGGKVDVLRTLKFPREVSRRRLAKLLRAESRLFASATVFDSQGKPVTGKNVSFQWKDGKSELATNDRGVVRLPLSVEKARDLVVEAPRDHRILLELTDGDGNRQPLPMGAVGLDRTRIASAGGTVVLEAMNQLAASDAVDRFRTGCRHQIHLFKVSAGETYTIDLESTGFDPFLRVEDTTGLILAEDDDGAGNLNARLVYRPARSDTIRIIVTTFDGGQTGAYRLTVRQEGKDETLEFAARLALERNPKDTMAHFNLGNLLRTRGNLEGSIAAFRKAVEVDPSNALFHKQLGDTLYLKKDLEGATAAYRKAVALDPKDAPAHNALGQALMLQARFADAGDAYRRAADLFKSNNPFGAQLAGQKARECERLLAMGKQLPALLEGREQPKDNPSRFLLVEFARSRGMFAQASRLIADGMAADAKLADNLPAGHRYNAACYAALAAMGQGLDATKMPEVERTRLRNQAMKWLRADLAAWAKRLEKGNFADHMLAKQMLEHWKRDSDLVGLRDPAPLKKLPADERAACQKLWADLETLLHKASEAIPPPMLAQQPMYTKFSPRIVKQFKEAVSPGKCTVRVRCNGKDAALGTIVAADGWIVTKSSELTGKITCKLPDGKEVAAVIKGIHEPYDLALLKVDAKALVPVTWYDSKAASVGRWVVSAGAGPEPAAIGVVSVATRPLRPGDQPVKAMLDSGYLGVSTQDIAGGSKITVISPASPAEKAGLKIGDIITHVGTRKTPTLQTLIDIIGRHKPGDVVTLKIKRGKDNVEVKATLARRPPQLLGNPQDRFGSVLSSRRGGFPLILQHDTILKHTDCGGPLVDLDGKVVGINIARAGRVESYAIPAEAIRELLPALLSGKLAPKDDPN